MLIVILIWISSIFQRGIRCFQDYADKCISDPAKLRLLEGEVMPAKNFHEMLCKDKMFREDYLSHGKCFQFVEKVNILIINYHHHIYIYSYTYFSSRIGKRARIFSTKSWTRSSLGWKENVKAISTPNICISAGLFTIHNDQSFKNYQVLF